VADLLRLAAHAVRSHRLRSLLSIIGIAIGVGSVILLTSIGEGTKVYLIDQFTQFGTDIVVVTPGKTETVGIPGILGGTTHPLTVEDAMALERLPQVVHAAPMAFGTARVEGGQRGRSVFVYGVTPQLPEVFKMDVRQGTFWSGDDLRRSDNAAVLGPKLKYELFGDESALGDFVRIAGTRFRVIGIMESKGQMVGFDMDDAAWIPVATAMRIFNMEEVTEIDVVFNPSYRVTDTEAAIREVLTARHGGRDDVTIMSQEAMLETFDNVMNMITVGVGAIGGISLLVGSVGILTMMWIAVGERTREIGLMRSVGATRAQVRTIFLAEAGTLATLGGALGLVAALAICQLLRDLVPGLPVHTPLSFVLLALLVSLITGLASGVLPAQRAATLDPIESLRTE
jgi:putative ABC transport system permease protein